jgi:tripeptide aminopeptidase
MLAAELRALGLPHPEVDDGCYLYARLPAPGGNEAPALTFCAHLDTSPSVSGSGVAPVLHPDYDGGAIRFSRAPDLRLTPEDSPELLRFTGDTIVTASGDTLLGADDKAGIAAIMAAVRVFQRFPELPRPEIRIVFTPDEEIGQGVDRIRMDRLGPVGYTVDGGEMGEIEDECFHAEEVKLAFRGRNVHPGYAKNRMVNAAAQAARFLAGLPESDAPEHAEGREGFWHLTGLAGDESAAEATLILRDFDAGGVARRRQLVDCQAASFRARCPGLGIDIAVREQYRNMGEVLARHPEVIRRAEKAIEMAGVRPIRRAIRGGTDGARLSFLGMPTPNLFAGGMLFHSLKEWIPARALGKSAETLVHLAGLWSGPDAP